MELEGKNLLNSKGNVARDNQWHLICGLSRSQGWISLSVTMKKINWYLLCDGEPYNTGLKQIWIG